ncbi:MAG: hypothetical protein IJ731_10270 [Eubacterium sp.]|nr:hypothetical protein [Eubacterium sp.]
MKSSKSLFSSTLFKSNIKRFLPFSILLLIIEFIIYPLIIYTNYNMKERLDFDSIVTMGIASDVFAFGFAGVFAILVFGYLFSANKCNALHAFPIGRKALFTTNLLSAYALLVVPQLIGFLLGLPGILMFMGTAKATLASVLMPLASIFLFSFIVLSIAVLSMMLAGNAFSGAVIYFILNFLYSALVGIVSYSTAIFGTGFSDDIFIDESSYLFSPVVNIIIKLLDYDLKTKIFVPDFFKALVVYFVVSIGICAIAFLLYKLRELEVAGEMAAFEIELPFIRVIVSIIGSFVISIFVGSMLSFGKFGFLALYIIFSFIVYFATQMILKKKFNIFSASLIIRWVICCAVSVGIVIALATYETNYIPEVKDVESSKVNISYNIESKEEENIKLVCDLQKELIEYAKNDKANRFTPFEVVEAEVDYDNYYAIQFTHYLKNGKEIEREYEYRLGNKKIDSLIETIERKNEYTNIFDYLDKNGVKYDITDISVTDYTKGDVSKGIDKKDFDAFTKLCREDVEKLTEDYSTVNNLINGNGEYNSDDTAFEIWFECRVSKSEIETLKRIEIKQSNMFAEGYFNLYEVGNGKDYELSIYITELPKDSRVLNFVKNYEPSL